jgi:glycosyltransferase involved in cell wall biosynthesis
VPSERSLAVLLVCPDSTGGIGRHVRTLAEGLLARGQRVTVCAPAATIEGFGLTGTSAATVALPVAGVRHWPRVAKRLRALAAAHDVTHAHGVRAGAQAAMAGARPLVTTWHNAPIGSQGRRAVHRVLEAVCARRSALVLAASEDLLARARVAGAADARLCEVTAPAGRAAAPMRAAALHSPPVVLAVARLHSQKRLDLLIDAAARWPAGPDRPQVLVAGAGPLADRLAQQARLTGAPVTLLGARDDVADLMAAADVVVLSSDWEARPLVAQEALRAGVPLVATDVGGVRALVGDAAVLVPPGDARALAEAVRRVLTDEALRRRLHDAGPVQASRWPTVEEMVDGILASYLNVNTRLSS